MLVPPWIPAHPKLLCVGQSPAREEAERGRPFIGTDGRQLRRWLAQCGLDPDLDVAYDNVVMEYHGRHDYKPTAKEIKAAQTRIPYLVAGLPSVRAIVLLGGPACSLAFTGGVTRVQGRVTEWAGLSTFACWHPGAYRNARSATERAKKELDTLDVLARAARVANGEPIPTVELPAYREEAHVVLR